MKKRLTRGKKKKQKTKVQGPIADLTSSILYLSCCVFNIIGLDLKHKSTYTPDNFTKHTLLLLARVNQHPQAYHEEWMDGW
jgi:hypothetical protein